MSDDDWDSIEGWFIWAGFAAFIGTAMMADVDFLWGVIIGIGVGIIPHVIRPLFRGDFLSAAGAIAAPVVLFAWLFAILAGVIAAMWLWEHKLWVSAGLFVCGFFGAQLLAKETSLLDRIKGGIFLGVFLVAAFLIVGGALQLVLSFLDGSGTGGECARYSPENC